MITITYELALELKNAGFPQGNWGTYYSPNKVIMPVPRQLNTDGSIELDTINSYLHEGLVPEGDDVCYIPTLSELIEAYGDEFMGVERTYNVEKGKHNSWEATQRTWCCDEHGENRKYGYGSTPEEAVAKLWLELNKK